MDAKALVAEARRLRKQAERVRAQVGDAVMEMRIALARVERSQALRDQAKRHKH